MTDVRPVFADHEYPKPVAAMILHTLEVTSYSGDQPTSHFISLDGSEIKALQDVLERVLAKEVSLRDSLMQSQLYLIDTHLQSSEHERRG